MTDLDERLTQIASLFKTLSDPGRLKILFLLKERPHNVGELVEALGMEQSAVSHQLRVMRQARLVKPEAVGKTRVYSLADDHVFTILRQVQSHIEEEENQ